MSTLREELDKLNALLEAIELEEKPVEDKPVKKDRRSFKWYLRSKIGKNDLAWMDKEMDWDDAYRDENDGYTWYFPLKYSYNAERVAEAVRRNLNRGGLETRVTIIEPDNIDDEPTLRVRFKNNKKERETGINNLDESLDEDTKNDVRKILDKLSDKYGVYPRKIKFEGNSVNLVFKRDWMEDKKIMRYWDKVNDVLYEKYPIINIEASAD